MFRNGVLIWQFALELTTGNTGALLEFSPRRRITEKSVRGCRDEAATRRHPVFWQLQISRDFSEIISQKGDHALRHIKSDEPLISADRTERKIWSRAG